MKIKIANWNDKFLMHSVITELISNNNIKQPQGTNTSDWEKHMKLTPTDSGNIIYCDEHQISDTYFYNKRTRTFQKHHYSHSKREIKIIHKELHRLTVSAKHKDRIGRRIIKRLNVIYKNVGRLRVNHIEKNLKKIQTMLEEMAEDGVNNEKLEELQQEMFEGIEAKDKQ